MMEQPAATAAAPTPPAPKEQTLSSSAPVPPKSPAPTPAPKRTLDATDPESARKLMPDMKVFGDPNAWVLLSKEHSKKERWMKSTKAYSIDNVGVLVQVSTQQENDEGSVCAVAEALQFIPGVKVVEEKDGSGTVVNRRLRHIL